MGNTLNPQCWSSVPANNDGIDAGIGTISNQMQTASVDDVDRGIMASVHNFAKDIGGAIVAGGTDNAITLTTNQQYSAAHVVAGASLRFLATATNTAGMTVNVDTIGPQLLEDQFGNVLLPGSVTLDGIYDIAFNANTNSWRLLNPSVLSAASGIGSSAVVLLATSAVTPGAATLDILINSYGSTYRGFKFVLTWFVPVTDAVSLGVRFSTDSGASYVTTGYSYNSHAILDSTSTPVVDRSDTWNGIPIAGLSVGGVANRIGNDITEGYNGEVTFLFPNNSFARKRLHHQGYYFSAAAPTGGVHIVGGGGFGSLNAVDAVRFYFSSGNIAHGNYAVYGLR
jgi:hypothetical protein